MYACVFMYMNVCVCVCVCVFEPSASAALLTFGTATTITLLPLLLGRSAVADKHLLDALQSFVQRRFPTRSRDYAAGSTELMALLACIDRILECMITSGHIAVVEVRHVNLPKLLSRFPSFFSWHI